LPTIFLYAELQNASDEGHQRDDDALLKWCIDRPGEFNRF